MIYHDPLYGTQEISEPVILDLLTNPALKRLDGISQHGYGAILPAGLDFSRLEHSIGVFLLLREHGAPLLEQVAGLLHDISHSVFSHIIDYALPGGSGKDQAHSDQIFNDFLKTSQLEDIINKYGLDFSALSQEANFPLKERELPELCADRLDYSLRLAKSSGLISAAEANQLLSQLSVQSGAWVFSNQTAAQRYGDIFRQLNAAHYASLSGAAMNHSCGNCLRHALEQGYLTLTDLYTQDQGVIDKIKQHLADDSELKRLYQRMNNLIKYENNPQDYQYAVVLKSRIVDPLFIDAGNIVRLSDKNPNWKEVVASELLPKTYYLKYQV